ncbi:hypothetical protein IQ266_27380 [filamentous cyanobacterium LEGE 11480]|uniref:Uncharacterized protein n=1 Tax=Romeriopsis navalis LEGE 11480 TaxID=2777977 RepID=A0A928VTI6_9CYAN|nr:hypothetical protein [Romeriopsis navalis]MBE9033458.1 hypothetical protein [Romeriopsis navalis LEGE 11480]
MSNIENSGNNAKVAYEYTKDVLAEVSSSYNAITTKLTTALGFSGVLLKFAADLSDKSWLIHVKMLVCAGLIFAVIACGIGLFPRSSGNGAVPPGTYLYDETGKYYGQTEENFYIQVGRGLERSLKGIEKTRAWRLKCLTATTYAIGLAAIGFAISIAGTSIMFPK